MTLLTISKHPYLWWFYKSLDMAKRNNLPIIAQEKYFVKPSEMAKKGPAEDRLVNNTNAINYRFIYDPPRDEDLERISQYPIPQEMEDRFIKEKGSVNDAMVCALSDSWHELEELLDRYFTEIEEKSGEKIDAVVTLCWFKTLNNAAEKHNIKVITIEQGLFREPAYLKTAYCSFTNLFDDEKEIGERYEKFRTEADELPILSRKAILSLLLNNDYLGYLNYYDMLPRYEAGVALGYATWLPHMCTTKFNDEELLYRTASVYDKFIVRTHPGDPTKASYPSFIKTPDNSANTIEFILKCKRIISLGSNVSLEAAFWNKVPCTALKCSSSYGQKHEVEDTQEYSIDTLYLNFFAFCFLIPYSKMMDPEYLMWRLSGPSESEIFKKHMKIYLEERGCDYDKLLSTADEKRQEYILSCRGVNSLTELSLPTASAFVRKERIDLSPEKAAAVAAENQVLKRELNEHISAEARYEHVILRQKEELEKAKKRYITAERKYKKLKACNAAYYKQAYEAVLNSNSWRLTKPFRAIMSLIRRIFAKNGGDKAVQKQLETKS